MTNWSNYSTDLISAQLVEALPMATTYVYGPGVAAKLAAEGDVATSSEVYYKDGNGINMFSKTTGKKGEYTYVFGENVTHFTPFLT